MFLSSYGISSWPTVRLLGEKINDASRMTRQFAKALLRFVCFDNCGDEVSEEKIIKKFFKYYIIMQLLFEFEFRCFGTELFLDPVDIVGDAGIDCG